MFDKFKAFRKFNGDIDIIYRKFKALNLNEKVDNTTFKKDLSSFYSQVKTNEKYGEYYDYCLKKRYNLIRNSYGSVYDLTNTWISSFVPTIMLTNINDHLFTNIPTEKLVIAFILAYILLMVIMIIPFLISSVLILPWVFHLHPSKTYEKYNIEMSEIAQYWRKKDIITNDYINKKDIKIRFIIKGISALSLSAITLLIYFLIK